MGRAGAKTSRAFRVALLVRRLASHGAALASTALMTLGAMAVSVDLLHAALMVTWFSGLPLLFWHRWPILSRAYAAYALAFVLVSQLSQWVLGQCILTSAAQAIWESQPSGTAPADASEWSTVRLARAVFRWAPSHRAIARISELLVLLTAVGVIRSLRPRAAGVASANAGPSRTAECASTRRSRAAPARAPYSSQ